MYKANFQSGASNKGSCLFPGFPPLFYPSLFKEFKIRTHAVRRRQRMRTNGVSLA